MSEEGTSKAHERAGEGPGIVRALFACGLAATIFAGCLPGRVRSAWTDGRVDRFPNGVDAVGDLGSGPLALAAMRGELEEVRRLMDDGEEADATDAGFGNSPLMFAARQGHVEVAELLIERGADVNHRNRDGASVLMWAAGQGDVDMVKLLLDRGADVRLENNTGMTAVDYSDRSGNRELETYLVQLAKAKPPQEASGTEGNSVNRTGSE